MGVNSLPSAWRTNLRTDPYTDREYRFYLDPRGIEYPDLGTGSAAYTLAREDNLIDRGNCESATGPAMFGENPSDDGQGTATLQDSTVSHGGDYSVKWNKDTAIGAGAPQYYFCDNNNFDDMHGFVAGETYEFSIWVQVDSSSGATASGVKLQFWQSTDGTSWTDTDSVSATGADVFEELTMQITVEDDARGCFPFINIDGADPQNAFINFDDLRVTCHSVPGSHYLSSGYIETLCEMTETFTLQIKFKPNFAYDTASNQRLCGWYGGSSTQDFAVFYDVSNDQFEIHWEDGGTTRVLASAQYDDGTTYRNINQWITLTAAIDLSTGTTAGSSLWLDKTQDDTAWSGNIDAKSTEFNKLQIRAYDGTAGDYDIAYVRYWPNRILTDAEVQNDGKDVADEEIFWSLDGHGTGRTRCNVSDFFVGYDIYKGVTSKYSASHGTNLLNFRLKNLQGEFSDDQYAAFTPTSYQYNGTSSQAYLQRRMGVMLESWYSGDFEHLYVGRLTEQGLQRQSHNHRISYVTGTAEDGVGDIDRTFETNGRKYDSYDIVDETTQTSSLFHTIAHLADRYNKQYLANNSFENATIGNSWLVTGGTLNKDSADGLFGSASGELVLVAGAEQAYQTIMFDGSDKLNVGNIFTFWCWVKSTAAATGADNYIEISEQDSAGENDVTQQTYTLAGGEGYKAVEVTHTITDSDSDRLVVYIGAAAGDTINIDGCMLVRCKSAFNYFDENTNDGASGVEDADDAVDISWPWFGVDAESVAYTHPWRRVEAGTSIWENLKSLANASGPKYCGMSECNTLTLKAVLQTDYSDDVPINEITTPRKNINVGLDELAYNKLVGHGVKIVKSTNERLIWLASSTGNFSDPDGDNVLSETVANGDTWPDPDDYPEYWAQFGASGDRRLQSNLTLFPSGLVNNDGELRIMPDLPTRIKEYWTEIWNNAYTTVPTSKREKIIGLQNADLFMKAANTGDGAGDWAETIFDVNSKPGQARILFTNDTGAEDTLREAAIVGQPVYIFEGEEGFINDGHIDWVDINKNGERQLDFGGSDVISQTQLNYLGDYLWKDRGNRKHVYSMMFAGTAHDFSPSDVYKITIGTAGETEYITSTAEVISVRIEHRPGSLGQTQIIFRELEEAWKYDSNVYSRFLARGVLVQSPSTGSVVTVGSEYSTVPTDFRIPIGETSAEDIINNAIDFVSGAFGGGTVHLSKGTYKIDGAISLKEGVIIEGEGDGTVIEKNCNDYAIKCVGGSGTEINNAGIRNLKVTRNASDTNAKYLIYTYYADDFLINGVTADGSYWGSTYIENCDNCIFTEIKIAGWGTGATYGMYVIGCDSPIFNNLIIDGESGNVRYGLVITACDRAIVTDLVIKNMANTESAAVTGFFLDATRSVRITGVVIQDITTTQSTNIYGMQLDSDACQIAGLEINNVDNSDTAANSVGLRITGDDSVISSYYVTGCSGTGVLITLNANETMLSSGRSTANGTNYSDLGTNTQIAAVDNT